MEGETVAVGDPRRLPAGVLTKEQSREEMDGAGRHDHRRRGGAEDASYRAIVDVLVERRISAAGPLCRAAGAG
ncbi:hypothetical protein ABNF97_33605 [Plantactinospora sp. B6F1]|uniref:hypothetical protein n=1 Tax=Plantactinospora sp. B6F1 TaxID=3158971 RepID=UPI00102C7427